ncbi:MAG: hypothetical protein IPH07_12110 [Deltaproteobacteria bacterium]|nr:hypothetical protein [Deltaproteobacteria bacterium]MBK8241469.1 hypothetical protein [Deltaproteobacteria bacterium]MBK8717181.1 hypothetical protein [Deltaproteobacteria bacterium]MBP7286295.1 hypothetical protein [Nannocystaceae bacterium]
MPDRRAGRAPAIVVRVRWRALCPWILLGCTASATDDADGESGDTHAAEGTASGHGSDGGHVDPCTATPTRSGEATYYDFADGSGNCGFPATPDDPLVAAMNHVDYAGSSACGTCVRVQGPDGSVDVRIVDQCPECPAGDIDLSPGAFERIAPLTAGRVAITWQVIPCAVEGPVVYHFKDGSNPWWTAVQLRNHRHGIARFEFSQAGAWVEVPRLDYNYFVQDSGMGEGPLDLRITDVHGVVLEDHAIALVADADVPGAAQFPACDGG